ncbi:carbohydrate kinase family protein [Nonomuraea ferruginea]
MNGQGLLVIGDVVTDVVAMHGAPVMSGPDIPSDIAADIALRPGGSGANTAAWAAFLGADASLLARCGYDSSEWHITELTKSGVRPHIRIDAANPTAVVISMVDSTGERSMLTNRGVGELISPPRLGRRAPRRRDAPARLRLHPVQRARPGPEQAGHGEGDRRGGPRSASTRPRRARSPGSA